MLREQLADTLKVAMKARDQVTVSTVRLILAALKDRDIATRGEDREEGLSDDEILQMLTTMVRQRRESIALYEQGKRDDLAAREAAEIEVIGRFMPRQLDDAEMAAAITQVIDELGAMNLKDMGRTMGALKERYAGQMNFAKASGLVKQQLA
jgi:uncharacterized protein YqeY